MKNLSFFILFMLLLGACGGKQVITEPNEETPSEKIIPDREASISKKEKTIKMGPYAETFNDSNYIQYATAEKLGILPIESLDLAYHTRRPLVKVETCDNYMVDYLTHSMPYLVPEAARLLNEIGQAFGDSLEKRGKDRRNRFVVTSLLRSPYTVRKLMRVNTNAVDSSTHKFATTFDIAYNKFDTHRASGTISTQTMLDVLAHVLLDKRNEGKCYVKYEIQSPCFHITARK